MFIATLLLLVSLPSLTSGQRTDVALDSCTYSFVVQSSQCWRNDNSVLETEVAKLRETVASLSDRLKDVDEAIKGMKEASTAVDTIRPTTLTPANDGRTVYIYLGCPQHMNINIVYFVPISHVPSTVHVITVNFSDTDNGLRLLLRPTLHPFPVFCTIDKYITIQRRRFPGSDSFNASWEEYREGFGDVSGGEFWLGLEKLHRITGQPHVKYSLRLEMKQRGGAHYYSEYSDFHIADESQKYKVLSIGQKTASNFNYFLKVGSVFATPDNDQKYKCGSRYNGFWYYENSNRATIGCSQITFNSDVFPLWYKMSGTTELTEMKIRLQGV